MSKYLETAAQARALAQGIEDLVPKCDKGRVAELLARLANMVVRSCPRGVQHTVRYNIVREVVRGMKVKVGMEERKDERTGRTYHALTTQRTDVESTPVAEVASED